MSRDILKYFRYSHLKPELQEMSRPFAEMAEWLRRYPVDMLDEAEREVALRKLLEAKDAAVRARL